MEKELREVLIEQIRLSREGFEVAKERFLDGQKLFEENLDKKNQLLQLGYKEHYDEFLKAIRGAAKVMVDSYSEAILETYKIRKDVSDMCDSIHAEEELKIFALGEFDRFISELKELREKTEKSVY